MAFHPNKYGITRAISSLKTQKGNQWHYLPFGLFYLYCKLFVMTSPIKAKNHSNRAHFTSSFFFFQISSESPAHPSTPRWVWWMFLNSQLHALIFLSGILSTHFLVIGKFWKMKWNSMFDDKTGICFDFSMLVLSLLFELSTFLSLVVSYLFGFLLAGLCLHWVILYKSWSYTPRYDDSFTLFLFYEFLVLLHLLGWKIEKGKDYSLLS